MSSYADAAANTNRKLDSAASNAEGNAKVDADKLKKKAGETASDAKKKLSDLEKDGKSKLDETEDFLKKYYNIFSSYVSDFGGKVSAKSSDVSSKAYKELQNPAVIGQIIATFGALGAFYVGYIERSKIFNSNHKCVVSAHVAVVTGFVLLDGFLFNKYYNKYKK
ncbi:hypothetical protein PACTADRAFT_81957 [Pachysolen tannophilus NRRL Y-2460]|uniref:Mitochondrial outer membrane protein OM14 C-terminal domain-containing protein n=1 Tax=Pachysolen tannophilus NRRL Y-2460 TaxID=669874 RepID=A0A1E4TRJ5_PACTA|nr:hypothetical protein PACTADRAFT_81957 [Pachysolen tannophilus NRRL Y-2460]